jgi:hypothetical protein
MILATTGVSVSQHLVRLVLNALGYRRRNRVLVHAWALSTEIAKTVPWSVAIGMKQRKFGLFQTTRIASHETVEAHTGT